MRRAAGLVGHGVSGLDTLDTAGRDCVCVAGVTTRPGRSSGQCVSTACAMAGDLAPTDHDGTPWGHGQERRYAALRRCRRDGRFEQGPEKGALFLDGLAPPV